MESDTLLRSESIGPGVDAASDEVSSPAASTPDAAYPESGRDEGSFVMPGISASDLLTWFG